MLRAAHPPLPSPRLPSPLRDQWWVSPALCRKNPPLIADSAAAGRVPIAFPAVNSYRRVLVGTDGSASSYLAVERAAQIARGAGAELLIACAYRPMPARERQEAADVLGEESYKVAGSTPAEDVLRGAVERVGDGDLTVDTIAVEGDPVDVLVGLAKKREADLVVVGNRGMGSLAGRLLGSVPSVVSHRSPCDVLIVATT